MANKRYFFPGQSNLCSVVIDVQGKYSVICRFQALCHILQNAHFTVLFQN